MDNKFFGSRDIYVTVIARLEKNMLISSFSPGLCFIACNAANIASKIG